MLLHVHSQLHQFLLDNLDIPLCLHSGGDSAASDIHVFNIISVKLNPKVALFELLPDLSLIQFQWHLFNV